MPRQNLLLFRNRGRAENFEEKEFLRLCLKGDRQAFERIVETYRDQVYWTAYNLVLDSEDARDVAQQSFLKVWKSLPEYDFEKSFSGWVSKITANCAIDLLRSRKYMEPLETDKAPSRELVSLIHPALERSIDIQKIFQRVAPLLSQRQRVVLVLREIYGMEMSEIADLMQCTESTVRNTLSQAKDSFRKKIQELFPEYGM
jgi:RNA polymerase sigma-70 factor (ECF subfamily)